MKGISSSEFYDKLYYGADIDLCYHSVFYHICAGYEDGSLHSITVYEYDKNKYDIDENQEHIIKKYIANQTSTLQKTLVHF